MNKPFESKNRHTTRGSGRSARQSSRETSGKIWCKQNYSPGNKRSTVPSKASNKRRFNIPSEARTCKILFKTVKEQNHLLNRVLSSVNQLGRERPLFLAADQLTGTFLSLLTLFMQGMSWNLPCPKHGHTTGGSSDQQQG